MGGLPIIIAPTSGRQNVGTEKQKRLQSPVLDVNISSVYSQVERDVWHPIPSVVMGFLLRSTVSWALPMITGFILATGLIFSWSMLAVILQRLLETSGVPPTKSCHL